MNNTLLVAFTIAMPNIRMSNATLLSLPKMNAVDCQKKHKRPVHTLQKTNKITMASGLCISQWEHLCRTL